MSYEYSLPRDKKIAIYLLSITVLALGVSVCVIPSSLPSVIVGPMFVVSSFCVMDEAMFRIRVKRDEIAVRGLLGWRVYSRNDITGVQVGIPGLHGMKDTYIHFRNQRRSISFGELPSEPQKARDVESGEERELSSLLVEWFGAYSPDSEIDRPTGESGCTQADTARVPGVSCGHDGGAEDGHSLPRRSGTIDYLYSWPPVRWGRQCLLLALPLAAGVFCYYYLAQQGNQYGAIMTSVVCLAAFGVLLFELMLRRLQIRVTRDAIQDRKVCGWTTYHRADILGVQEGIPLGKELSATVVHFKNRRQDFSFLERWRKPTMACHAETGEERELTPLLVELFGVYTPESENKASSAKQEGES